MQQQLENTLAKLVAFPSWSDNSEACRQIIGFVREELEPLGLHITAEIELKHPWLIATTQPTKEPKILLVAHLDVVPAIEESQYELHMDGDRVYGRGVWDMKYAAAGFIEFLKTNAATLHEFDLGVLFTTDEEIGGYQGVRQVLKEGWRTQLAFIPDYGDDWRIEENAKGLHTVKVCADGKSAHGSRPWEGENAIQKLIPVLHELQTLYPSADHYGPTISINIINGGEAINQIADSAYAVIDFRAFGMQELEDFRTVLDRFVIEKGITHEEVSMGHPLALDKENPLVRRYFETLEANGITLKFDKSFGGSDGRWFAEYDIPCIITGPHGEGAHGPTEWVKRQDLLTFYKILTHFVENNARVGVLDAASRTVHTL